MRLSSSTLAALGLLAAALCVRLWVGQPVWISNDSMAPALRAGDIIWMSRSWQKAGSPPSAQLVEPGAVLVYHLPAEQVRAVRRVVGLPGQRAEVYQGHVIINGASAATGARDTALIDGCTTATPIVQEQLGGAGWYVRLGGPAGGPARVPERSLWMLGDDRARASDSRQWGAISVEMIEGRAARILWSWDDCRGLPRWNRIGTAL